MLNFFFIEISYINLGEIQGNSREKEEFTTQCEYRLIYVVGDEPMKATYFHKPSYDIQKEKFAKSLQERKRHRNAKSQPLCK